MPACCPLVQQIFPLPQLVLVHTHFPFEHDGVSPEQSFPQAPQLVAVLRFVQTPLQHPCPGEHATQMPPAVPHVWVLGDWHVLF